jgi:hypothetical protein
MLASAVEAEVQDFLSRHQLLRDDQGRQRSAQWLSAGFDHPALDLLPQIMSLHVHLPAAIDGACYNLLGLA